MSTVACARIYSKPRDMEHPHNSLLKATLGASTQDKNKKEQPFITCALASSTIRIASDKMTPEIIDRVTAINKTKSIRGILEGLFLCDNKTKMQSAHILRIGMGVATCSAACCGGAVCTFCLHGIPTYEEVVNYGEKGPYPKHHVTHSVERCLCTYLYASYKMYRWMFSNSQGYFFVDEEMAGMYKQIVSALKGNKCQDVITALEKVRDYLFEKHKPIIETDPERYNRVLLYDAHLTFDGVACSLCKIKRVDMTMNGTHFPKPNPSLSFSTCYDCIYQLSLSQHGKTSPSLEELTLEMAESERRICERSFRK